MRGSYAKRIPSTLRRELDLPHMIIEYSGWEPVFRAEILWHKIASGHPQLFRGRLILGERRISCIDSVEPNPKVLNLLLRSEMLDYKLFVDMVGAYGMTDMVPELAKHASHTSLYLCVVCAMKFHHTDTFRALLALVDPHDSMITNGAMLYANMEMMDLINIEKYYTGSGWIASAVKYKNMDPLKWFVSRGMVDRLTINRCVRENSSAEFYREWRAWSLEWSNTCDNARGRKAKDPLYKVLNRYNQA